MNADLDETSGVYTVPWIPRTEPERRERPRYRDVDKWSIRVVVWACLGLGVAFAGVVSSGRRLQHAAQSRGHGDRFRGVAPWAYPRNGVEVAPWRPHRDSGADPGERNPPVGARREGGR